MQFKFVGPHPVDIPSLSLSLDCGDVFEATGDAAQSLLDQPSNFERIDDPKKEK